MEGGPDLLHDGIWKTTGTEPIICSRFCMHTQSPFLLQQKPPKTKWCQTTLQFYLFAPGEHATHTARMTYLRGLYTETMMPSTRYSMGVRKT